MNAPAASALGKAQTQVMLASEATKLALVEVMLRLKFDRFIEVEIRKRLAREYIRACADVTVHSTVRVCRDAKDDRFLALAVDGRADLILSGDCDLLVLSPFRGIPVITPTQYLEED